MIPYLLFYKILQLSVVMVLGFLLVKTGILKSEDSKALSKISIYLLIPAVIINAFDIDMTFDIMQGLLLGVISAILIHIIFLLMGKGYRRFFRGTDVELASIIYSNAGNLIVPIVLFVLGEEWLMYSCCYMSVQIIYFWTHGIRLFSAEKFQWKKILLNTNILAILVGVLLMASGIRLPVFVKEITSSLGSMVGNIGMLIAGMLAAEVDFKGMLRNKRMYLVLVMRMILFPLAVFAGMKAVLPYLQVPHADKVLLISFLACSTPAASTIMQMAKIHDKDADFAVAVNIVTTIACIITMPVFVALF